MVIDGWASAGGRPEALRYLGISHIVNNAGLTSIRAELARQNAQPGQTITTSPAEPTWDQNPFARCGSRVAEALGLLVPATVRAKGYLKLPGADEDPREGTSMVIEFGDFEELAPLHLPERDTSQDATPSKSNSAFLDPQIAQELAEEEGFDLFSFNIKVQR